MYNQRDSLQVEKINVNHEDHQHILPSSPTHKSPTYCRFACSAIVFILGMSAAIISVLRSGNTKGIMVSRVSHLRNAPQCSTTHGCSTCLQWWSSAYNPQICGTPKDAKEHCENWFGRQPQQHGCAISAVQFHRKLFTSVAQQHHTWFPTGESRANRSTALWKLAAFLRVCLAQRDNAANLSHYQRRIMQHLSFNEWPVINDEPPSVETAAGALLRVFGLSTFFAISVIRDVTNRSRHVIQLREPTELFQTYNIKSLDAMRVAIRTQLQGFVSGANLETIATDVFALVARIVRFRLKSSAWQSRNNVERLTTKPLKELYVRDESFKWLKFFGEIFAGARPISEEDMIQTTANEYIEHMRHIFNSVSQKTLANFLGLHVYTRLLRPLFGQHGENSGSFFDVENVLDSQHVVDHCIYLAAKAMPLLTEKILHTAIIEALDAQGGNSFSRGIHLGRHFVKNFVDISMWPELASKLILKQKIDAAAAESLWAHSGLISMSTEIFDIVYISSAVRLNDIFDSYMVLRNATMEVYWSQLLTVPQQSSLMRLWQPLEHSRLPLPWTQFPYGRGSYFHGDSTLATAQISLWFVTSVLDLMTPRKSLYTVQGIPKPWWTDDTTLMFQATSSCLQKVSNKKNAVVDHRFLIWQQVELPIFREISRALAMRANASDRVAFSDAFQSLLTAIQCSKIAYSTDEKKHHFAFELGTMQSVGLISCSSNDLRLSSHCSLMRNTINVLQ